MRKFITLILVFIILFSLVAYSAQNQQENRAHHTYPIEIIVFNHTGSIEDTIARSISATAIHHFIQPISVVNQPNDFKETSNPLQVILTTNYEGLQPIIKIHVKKEMQNSTYYLAVSKDTPDETVSFLYENFKRTIQEEIFKNIIGQLGFDLSL